MRTNSTRMTELTAELTAREREREMSKNQLGSHISRAHHPKSADSRSEIQIERKR